MLNAFYAGVHSVNPAAKVLAPGMAPYGDDPPNAARTRPLVFLRRLLCLRKSGGSLVKTNCPDPAHFDILSHHPIDLSGSPNTAAINPDDASTPDVWKLIRVARTANRLGTLLPRMSNRPTWATELWWESDPPRHSDGWPMHLLERWVPESLYVLWKQGVDAAIWYQLLDEPNLSGYQTGLLFSDGQPKPIYQAWRFPFVTHRPSRSRVSAWMIPPASGQLQIQRRVGGRWRTVRRLQVRAGNVTQTAFSMRGRASLRAVIGGEASLARTQGA